MIKIAKRHERISMDPAIMGGKPCNKGTRIPVDLILRYLRDSQSAEDILERSPASPSTMYAPRRRLPLT